MLHKGLYYTPRASKDTGSKIKICIMSLVMKKQQRHRSACPVWTPFLSVAWITVKFQNFRTPENFVAIYLKLKQRGKKLRVFYRNDANVIANSEDPDQTALLVVWTGSALLSQTYLSENLGSLRYNILSLVYLKLRELVWFSFIWSDTLKLCFPMTWLLYFQHNWYTVMTLSFRTDRSWQTVQTQIRPLLWSGSSLFAIPLASSWLNTLRCGLFVRILGTLQQSFLASENLGTLRYTRATTYWATQIGRGSLMGSKAALDADGHEINPHVWHILSWRFGHEKISTAIFLDLLLIQEEQLSVNAERMYTKYW